MFFLNLASNRNKAQPNMQIPSKELVNPEAVLEVHRSYRFTRIFNRYTLITTNTEERIELVASSSRRIIAHGKEWAVLELKSLQFSLVNFKVTDHDSRTSVLALGSSGILELGALLQSGIDLKFFPPNKQFGKPPAGARIPKLLPRRKKKKLRHSSTFRGKQRNAGAVVSDTPVLSAVPPAGTAPATVTSAAIKPARVKRTTATSVALDVARSYYI